MMSYVYIQITTTVFQKCRVSYPEKKNFDRQYLAMCIIAIVTAASIYIYIYYYELYVYCARGC